MQIQQAQPSTARWTRKLGAVSNRLYDILNTPAFWVAAWFATIPLRAHAQNTIFANVTGAACSFLSEVVGPKSTLLSFLLVGLMAVAIVLWWMNESKEGLALFILKTIAVVSALVNIFSLPTMFGMKTISC